MAKQADFYRDGRIMYHANGKVHTEHKTINAAKRHSRELQFARYVVRACPVPSMSMH